MDVISGFLNDGHLLDISQDDSSQIFQQQNANFLSKFFFQVYIMVRHIFKKEATFMLKKMKRIVTLNYVQVFLYYLIRLYSRTFQMIIENESAWVKYYENGGNVLLCAYHQQFFPAIYFFKKYKSYHPGIMISKSSDGNIIAGIAKKTGWHTFRGSSSNGGLSALKAMIRHLKKKRFGAHVVDGPRGPAGIVKPGIVQMAETSRSVIVPFYIGADKAWYFNSWDNFFIPKPFAKIIIKFGDIIQFNDCKNKENFEYKRQFLERIMKKDNLHIQSRFQK